MNHIVEEIHADPELRKRLIKQFEIEGRPLTRQALHAWKILKHAVPANRVPTVARLMRKKRHEIRPDIWKPPGSSSSRFSVAAD
jgi:hypothetical protein